MLPQEHISEFLNALRVDALGLNNLTLEQLLETVEKKCLFEYHDTHVRWGEYTKTEEFCEKYGLPYRRVSEAKYKMEPTIIYSDGIEKHIAMCSHVNGSVFVPMIEIEESLASGTKLGIFSVVEKYRIFQNAIPALVFISTPRDRMKYIRQMEQWAHHQPYPEIAGAFLPKITHLVAM